MGWAIAGVPLILVVAGCFVFKVIRW
jgi:hypothetical protein